MDDNNNSNPKILTSLLALSPLLLFMVLFIGTGIYFSLQSQENAFYQISPSVIILPSIFLAVFLGFLGRRSFQKSLTLFLEGARDKNIIIMCFIYLLAGAFSTVLQSIGGVGSFVHCALNIVPTSLILPTLFLIASLISTAMGTSMGTIATIGPIAAGIASSLGLPLPLTMGTVIGGAMFGDNLSMISDTSIAATQTQGCSVLDKFKSNLKIALPAMFITLFVLTWLNPPSSEIIQPLYKVEWSHIIQCLPYLIVLVLALAGINVFNVLIVGIFSAGLIGLVTLPSYTLTTLSKNIFDGYKTMNEILILSLLMGGLGELIKQNNGFSLFNLCLIKLSRTKAKVSKRMAEGAISAIASFSDICTANNTVAIILSGTVTREIANAHEVSPVRSATLIDIFSCTFQGILPYSAQILMAGSLVGISPFSIAPYVFYCFFLGAAGVCAIFFQIPKSKVASPRGFEPLLSP